MITQLRYGAHVHANGIRQHYLRYGDAASPTLVLLPGITSPAAMWGFVAERLASAFDVYVIDVRGRGLSQSGADLDYGINELASDLRGFCHALGLEDAVWMGHSMGARIVTRAAREPLTRIRSLVLVDPPVSGPGRRPYPIPVQHYLDLLAHARAGRAWEALQGKTPRWPESLVRLRAEWAHTCFEAAVMQAHRDFHEDDFHADIPHLPMPIDLVIAGQGGVIRPEDVEEIGRLAPRLRHRTVQNAGHMIPFEELEDFCACVGDLLQVRIE
jgi:N-formylmaleamate deformylase